MEEYRRFISYMYLYEEGRKTINSGFVRVESRTEQCRILIHMSGVDHSRDDGYMVYMLIRESGGYIGIAVGEVQFRQQTAEREFVMDSEHLMGTEYGLNRVAGMVLLGENSRVYGTRWDDEPLETDKFVNKEQISEKLVRFGEKKAAAVTDEANAAQSVGDAAENETDADIDFGADNTAGRYADENPLIPEEAVAAFINAENSEADAAREYAENGERLFIQNETGLPVKQAEGQIEQDQPQFYNVCDLLMSQLPPMYPFEDDSVTACVRLELQDIGRMPMSCWMYGSNSFLLHGYYCYRHLILAKVEKGKNKEETNDYDENNRAAGREVVYLMGVPGIWQHREQYMASLFGFRKFKPVSQKNHGRGAFGYWCVELK